MRLTTVARTAPLAIFGTALMLALAIPAGAQTGNANPGSANTVDQQFVTQAIKSGDEEVTNAKAELNSTNNASVKLFAQTMIRDHTQANGQLAAAAQQLNLSYPKSTIQTSDSPDTTGTPPPGANRTGSAQPPQTYMQQEVADHQQAIALFENEAKNGGSAQLRAIAAQTLPTLKAHLAMAQQYMNTGRVSPEVTPTPAGPGMPPR